MTSLAYQLGLYDLEDDLISNSYGGRLTYEDIEVFTATIPLLLYRHRLPLPNSRFPLPYHRLIPEV
jgi:hypothetical protein